MKRLLGFVMVLLLMVAATGFSDYAPDPIQNSIQTVDDEVSTIVSGVTSDLCEEHTFSEIDIAGFMSSEMNDQVFKRVATYPTGHLASFSQHIDPGDSPVNTSLIDNITDFSDYITYRRARDGIRC